MLTLAGSIISWAILIAALIIVFLIIAVLVFVVIDEMGKAYENYKESRS